MPFPTITPTNKFRRERARRAIAAHADPGSPTEQPEEALIDLLTDIRHLLNDERAFSDAVRISETHYTAEVNSGD